MKRSIPLLLLPLSFFLNSCAGTPRTEREGITESFNPMREYSDPAQPVSRGDFLRAIGE